LPGDVQFVGSIASAGDVNGDGVADLLLADELTTELYYGNGGGGAAYRPRQSNGSGAARIAPGLRTDVPGEFRVAVDSHNSVGRTTFQLEAEVKEQGQSFDGLATWVGPPLDSQAPGSGEAQLTGLNPVGQHWRVRMLFDRASSPYVGWSRWIMLPTRGALEADAVLDTPCLGPTQSVTLTEATKAIGVDGTGVSLTWRIRSRAKRSPGTTSCSPRN
jgi:hypothetical protein